MRRWSRSPAGRRGKSIGWSCSRRGSRRCRRAAFRLDWALGAGMKSTASGRSPLGAASDQAISRVWTKPKKSICWRSAAAISCISGATTSQTERGLIQSSAAASRLRASSRRSGAARRELATAPSSVSTCRCSAETSCGSIGYAGVAETGQRRVLEPSQMRTRPCRRIRLKCSARLLTATVNSMNSSKALLRRESAPSVLST